MSIPKDYTAVTLLAVACIPLFFFMLAHWLHQRRAAKLLKSRLGHLDATIASFESRLLTIETHAVDYLNSLTPDGNKALYEVKELLGSARNLADEVQELIETRDMSAFYEADKLLRDDFTINDEMVTKFDGSRARRYPRCRNWKDVIENNLQQVGREISRASSRATDAGIPKRQKRQSTVMSLMQAGVRAVAQGVRMQNAPVRTLLRKNNSLKI